MTGPHRPSAAERDAVRLLHTPLAVVTCTRCGAGGRELQGEPPLCLSCWLRDQPPRVSAVSREDDELATELRHQSSDLHELADRRGDGKLRGVAERLAAVATLLVLPGDGAPSLAELRAQARQLQTEAAWTLREVTP